MDAQHIERPIEYKLNDLKITQKDHEQLFELYCMRSLRDQANKLNLNKFSDERIKKCLDLEIELLEREIYLSIGKQVVKNNGG